jgi:hypothetical protein
MEEDILNLPKYEEMLLQAEKAMQATQTKCLPAGDCQPVIPGSDGAKAAASQWEYHYQYGECFEVVKACSEVGLQGWELVSVVSDGTGKQVAYLKRQKPKQE